MHCGQKLPLIEVLLSCSKRELADWEIDSTGATDLRYNHVLYAAKRGRTVEIVKCRNTQILRGPDKQLPDLATQSTYMRSAVRKVDQV